MIKLQKMVIAFNCIAILLFIFANIQLWNSVDTLNEKIAITEISPMSITIRGPVYFQAMSPPSTAAPILYKLPNFPFWLFFIVTSINILFALMGVQRREVG